MRPAPAPAQRRLGLGRARRWRCCRRLAAILLIVGFGRLILRRLFRLVARTHNRELFMATILFVVVGTSLLTHVAGLSMALGAFLAGLLLAETEFRRQVEVDIEPFKGMLLGLFFISVGMRIDLAEVAQPAADARRLGVRHGGAEGGGDRRAGAAVPAGLAGRDRGQPAAGRRRRIRLPGARAGAVPAG